LLALGRIDQNDARAFFVDQKQAGGWRSRSSFLKISAADLASLFLRP
jgi:hypothetical protein